MRPRCSVWLGLALVGAAPNARAGELVMRFLDVGQGDAILLSHEGAHVLVDTGPTDQISHLLRARGVTALDLLVISHNHADHLGGADAVLLDFAVARVLDNELPAKSKLQDVVTELFAREGVAYVPPSGELDFGDLRLRILTPPDDVGGDVQNNASVGLIVEHGRFKALLTGDSEVEEINAWLTRGLIPDVDVLKAAHHGARNGVTPWWLQASRPEVVVISCGANNRYGHPEAMALRYYASGGRRVLRTDLVGTVLVRVQSDGSYIADAEPPPPPLAPERPARADPDPKPTTTVAPLPDASGKRACCVTCRRGQACGDACIASSATCRKPPGCACSSRVALPAGE